ncbi:TonB-dependent receptor [Draconibacterium orientale]|uniref:TonB-dependent receptor n=1 Tax=Draconibacterium orientale TaxID=1168034 RepID=UPI002A0A3A5A|nr:TonB-dependent receptor [Draconibacterium orientale]
MQKINWFLTLILLFSASNLWAQNVLFSGTVSEKNSGEPLVGASVYFNGTTLGAVTDKNGEFFIRSMKSGTYEVVVSCVGYHRVKEQITLSGSETKFDCELEKSASTLGEVVVTGTGTPHHLKSAPVQTELIDKKLIDRIAPADFNDLMLAVSPSVDFNPGVMGPFMQLNGLGNDYILVMIDGKRTYGDIGGQSDLNRINPANVEQIEVVKGASSALYGSEAIAGVINIITKKANNKIKLVNNSRVGSYGNLIQHNSLDLNFGRLSSSTSFDRKTTDGWQLSKYELDDDDLVETDAMAQNPSTDYTINQKLLYNLSQQLSVYVQGSKYQRDVERPLSVGKYGYYYDDFSYSAGAEYLLGKENRLTLDWNSDQFNYYYKYNQESGDFVAGDKAKQTEQLRQSLNLKGIFKLTDNHQLSVGGEYVNEELESEGRLLGTSADAYTLAFYAQDEMKFFENLSLVAGARYVNHKEFGNAFSPKVSALYKLKDFNFRGTYARGFKAPTLKELYYHYERRGSLYLGNSDLDPQTSNYYALSAEYIINRFSFSVTAYQNDVNDLIDYKTVETSEEDAANGVKSTRQHYNIAKAGTKGIDFLFNANLGAGFSFGGGYSYIDAQNKTDNIRLEGVAQNYGNIRLGYVHDWKKYQLTANLNGRFQDDKFYDDEYGNAKGYNLWNLTTIHRLKTKGAFDFELSAGVDNIFDYVDDSPYGSHYGTISPGRTYFVALQIAFNK